MNVNKILATEPVSISQDLTNVFVILDTNYAMDDAKVMELSLDLELIVIFLD